ncbi:MAG: hypothetical protein V3W34_07355 [Phycisphaerae bacterium]
MESLRPIHHILLRRGLGLVEVVLAIAITAILLASTTGVLGFFTLHGARLQLNESSRSQGALAMHQMRNELALATSVSALSDRAITFIVPDVDGDTLDDTIEYTWTGSIGDTLTRKLNGVPSSRMLMGVQSFALAFDVDTTTLKTVYVSLDANGSSPDTVVRLDTAMPCLNRPSLGGLALDNVSLHSPP